MFPQLVKEKKTILADKEDLDKVALLTMKGCGGQLRWLAERDR